MVNYLGPYSLTNANHHNGKLLGGMNRRIHIPAMRFLLHGGGGSCSRRRLPPAPQQEEPTAPVLVRPTDTRGPTGIPGRGPGPRPPGPSAGRPVSDRDRLPSLISDLSATPAAVNLGDALRPPPLLRGARREPCDRGPRRAGVAVAADWGYWVRGARTSVAVVGRWTGTCCSSRGPGGAGDPACEAD